MPAQPRVSPCREAKNKSWFGIRHSFRELDRSWTALSLSSEHAQRLLWDAEEGWGGPEAEEDQPEAEAQIGHLRVRNEAFPKVKGCLHAAVSVTATLAARLAQVRSQC